MTRSPLTTRPAAAVMTTTDTAAPTNDAQAAYDEAVKNMTDLAVLESVRAYHPHANTGPDALKAFVADYERLKGERDKAAE